MTMERTQNILSILLPVIAVAGLADGCIFRPPQPPPTTTAAPTTGSVLERQSLYSYPLAQCNDKTSAVYYRPPSMNQQSSVKKMLIYLKGGGHCVPGDGDNNCNERCTKNPHMCTAMLDPTFDLAAENLGDTFGTSNSTLNPAFHDFAKVYVPYCSSGLHSGTANASDATEGRVFHGKYIFKAMIADLLTYSWLGQAEEVVLIGTSAGAIGVERNCDWMAETLHGVKSDMDVKCVIDSGSIRPMTTFTDYCLANEQDHFDKQVLWEPELDESCMQNSPDPQACSGLTNSYKYLETTSMIVTSATDSLFISKCCEGCDDSEMQQFKQSWRDELAQVARNMSTDRQDWGFYIENCPFHTCMANKWIYHTHKVPVDDGPSPGEQKNLRVLLKNFWKQMSPRVGIDNMDALNPSCNSN